MNSKHVLLFVAMSLLIVGIVSSSVLKARALSPDPHFGSGGSDCVEYKFPKGPIYAKRCCWNQNNNQGSFTPGIQRMCQTCSTDDNGDNPYGCDPPQISRTLPGGPTTGPLNLTNTQNGGPINLPGGKNNPTFTGTTGLHNLPINKVGSSNTAPDNTILSTHHHKTSNNLGQTSRSASTGNSTGH